MQQGWEDLSKFQQAVLSEELFGHRAQQVLDAASQQFGQQFEDEEFYGAPVPKRIMPNLKVKFALHITAQHSTALHSTATLQRSAV